MIYYSMTVLWPTIIGSVYTTNVMQIGWQSSVIGGGVLCGQLISGIFISYVPGVKYQTIIASLLSMAFVTALSAISASGHAVVIAMGVLGCISIGFVDNITFPGVTLIIQPQDIGLATGVLGSIRACGGAVAQALYSSVLANKLKIYLPRYVAPAALSAGLPSASLPALFAGITAGNFSAVPDITPAIIAVVGTEVKHAYISSFKIVFYVTVPFSALLVLAACFVPNMEKYLGMNVAKRLQNIKGGSSKADLSEKKVAEVV
jgi:hypothetical protein